MRIGSLASDACKEAAVPWNAACTLSGMFKSFCALLIASVASPREAPGARLKEIVTTGNCPWRLTDSGAFCASKWVKALRGTAPPPETVTGAGFADPVAVLLELEEDGPDALLPEPPPGSTNPFDGVWPLVELVPLAAVRT